jgi:hypothetical protein
MLFPSEAAEQSRRELAEQLAAASIEPTVAFERMLALDPADRVALFEVSRLQQQAGGLAAAEATCRRGMDAHPCDYRFYIQLSGLLAQQGRDIALASGVMELGVLKLLGDTTTLEDAGRLQQMGKFPGAAAGFFDGPALEALAADLAEQREHEPPATGEVLRPYRLIHELQETLGNQMERELVDSILAAGDACRPLLVGVLRGLAQGYLPAGGELMAEAALALLGEIGDPQSLPPLVQFAIVDDPALSDIATWALLRIAGKQPAETVAAMGRFDRQSSGGERACIAETLASMPEAPGKAEVLEALFENFGAVAEAERSDTFVVISAARLSLLGKPAVTAVRKTFDGLKGVMPLESGPAVDDLLRAYAADPSAFAIPPEEDVPAVYDICGADRIQEDDEGEGEEEHVHGPGCTHGHDGGDEGGEEVAKQFRSNLPGRNDPCWCGSGKKYKKCHLEADEAAQRN